MGAKSVERIEIQSNPLLKMENLLPDLKVEERVCTSVVWLDLGSCETKREKRKGVCHLFLSLNSFFLLIVSFFFPS